MQTTNAVPPVAPRPVERRAENIPWATVVEPRPPAAALPTPWRTALAVVLLAALCDATIYHGRGFAGYAALIFAAPFLVTLGLWRHRIGIQAIFIGVLLAAFAARLAWNGSAGGVAIGFFLLFAFAMSAAGLKPILPKLGLFIVQTIPAGLVGAWEYSRRGPKIGADGRKWNWLAVVLPVVALLIFAPVFLMANPDLLTSVRQSFTQAFESLRNWLSDYGPAFDEVLFVLFAATIAMGMMRPIIWRFIEPHLARSPGKAPPTVSMTAPPAASDWLYVAVRNTLACVIVLFAVYLAFEFLTLWLGAELQEAREDWGTWFYDDDRTSIFSGTISDFPDPPPP